VFSYLLPILHWHSLLFSRHGRVLYSPRIYSSQPLNIPRQDYAKQSCPNFTKTQHLGYMISRVTMFKEGVVTAALVKIQVLWDMTLCRGGYRPCDSKDRPYCLCLVGSSTLLLAVQDEGTTIIGNVGNIIPTTRIVAYG